MVDLMDLNMPEPGMEDEQSYDASADESEQPEIDLSMVSDDMLKAEAEARGMVVEVAESDEEEDMDEDEYEDEMDESEEEAMMPSNSGMY